MRLADLATELEVPPSTVIEQCQRLGIDASWAGAELTAAQQTLVRVELAHDESPVRRDGAAPEAPVAADRADAGGGEVPASELPPTAVGSMPELAGSLAEEAGRDGSAATDRQGPSFAGAGLDPRGGRPAPTIEGASDRRAAAGRDRRLDPAIRPAVIAVVLAVALLVAAERVGGPAVVAALWAAAFLAFATAALAGNRARYRITTHPDRRAGLPLAALVLAVSVLGLAGLGTAVWVAARTAPAADAPLGLGDLRSVAQVRWGILRVGAIAADGWERPAKDAGTCWRASEPGDEAEPRRDERVEVGGDRVACADPHQHEVLAVFAVDRDADSPYPGVDRLRAVALRRCRPMVAAIDAPPADLVLEVEHPTADGWADGDHDVACVATTAREGSLG